MKYFFAVLFLLLVGSSCRKTDTLFVALPASKTNITFVNEPEQRTNLNIISYLYYYNGGGVSVGDVNNDGLPDIYFAANSRGRNKLYLNKGNFSFEDITEAAGVGGTADWCSGVTMADVNGDGYLDIYVSAVSNSFGLKGANQLFINNGAAPAGKVSFTESAALYGLNFSGLSTQAAFFDYDHDGDLDCYLLNHSQSQSSNIPDTISRNKQDNISGDRLFRNDMNTAAARFTDVTTQAGIYQSSLAFGLGLAVADFNNDGWEDVYTGNDFFENDYYYLNNGDGTFSESGAQYFNHYSRFSMGNDVADYNNDGLLDLITVDMLPFDEKVLKTYGSDEQPDIYRMKLQHNGYQHQYSRNCLQQNRGNSFSEQGLLAGVAATDWSWCPLFADFDNDGAKDLFITSGIVKRPMDLDFIHFFYSVLSQEGKDKEKAWEKMPDGRSHPFVFKGDGAGMFQDNSKAWGTDALDGYFNGAAYADLDNDGDLDLVINNLMAPATILQNQSANPQYLSLSFKGNGYNTKGIGAKAYLFYKDKMQYQQLMLTRGFESSSDARLHFGLGAEKKIDSLLVVWPDQRYQVIKNFDANKSIECVQQNASGVFQYDSFFMAKPSQLTELTTEIAVDWRHQENDFNDFSVQYLIPHAQSTRGPKVAVADVNGDGLDDMYVCGAKEQPGALLVQQQKGSFLQADTAVFAANRRSEDVDAVFFDANGDGFADLYVVSGGNEYRGDQPLLLDRLYLNDGAGHFTQSKESLPRIFENNSCVTVADIDKDGDADLFVGTLANPAAYGVPQTAYLLLNDGKGHFTIAPQNRMPLAQMGMVTAASFADVNKDGWPDLVVAGEWMPLTIMVNQKGSFRKTSLEHTTGWWQSIFIDDVNNDGNPDIMAGNWGWNNKFWSGKNGPLKLYVSDFDNNGQTDQLLSYTRQGKEFPFLAKDEIERSLPALRKHYPLYAQYAGVEMSLLFKGYAETVTPLRAERLGSVVAYGDGKGGFNLQDLPASLQLAPVFGIQRLPSLTQGENRYICAGNFFDVIPYEGRYDAQPLALFTISRSNSIAPLENLADLKGQYRDVKWIRTARHGSLLVVAGNNTPLRFFKP